MHAMLGNLESEMIGTLWIIGAGFTFLLPNSVEGLIMTYNTELALTVGTAVLLILQVYLFMSCALCL